MDLGMKRGRSILVWIHFCPIEGNKPIIKRELCFLAKYPITK